MANGLWRYVDSEFAYDFWRGPAEVRDVETARRDGLNCIALAHLVIADLFEYRLPPWMHCYEMLHDVERFDTIGAVEEVGDLVWFGLSSPNISLEDFKPHYEVKDGKVVLVNWQDNPVKHVGIHTGYEGRDGSPLILHATNQAGENGNAMWSLSEFAEHERYEQIYRISRFAVGSENALPGGAVDLAPLAASAERVPAFG